MSTPWLISDRVRDVAGPGLDGYLQQIDPAAALTCQVCGKVKPAGVITPMRVVIAAADADVPVIGFAHPDCRDLVGDVVAAMANRIDESGLIDARAVFAERSGVFPHAVLIFEPAAVHAALTAHDSVTPLLEMYLQRGFEPVATDVLDLAPPVAAGWRLDTGGGTIRLTHRQLPGNAYEQDINDSHTGWLTIVRRQRRCLVVTGAHLGLAPGVPVDLDWSRTHGLLVAATVPAR